MFILYAVIVGIAVGLALGGRIGALASIQFRWAPLIPLGFLIQILLFTDAVASRVGAAGPVIYVVSTAFVGAAVIRNLRVPGMPLILLGALSNMAAILANGGFMPAAAGAMAAVGRDVPTTYSNSSIVAEPALAPLVDQFALPRWLPFANVFSVGDAILAAGVVVLIAAAMRRDADGEAAPRRGDEPAIVGVEGQWLLRRSDVQGKPVVRRGRKARDLRPRRPPGCLRPTNLDRLGRSQV